MELEKQLKKYRAELKLTQEELAEKAYVSRQTVSNWETGKSYPDIHSLLLLSDLFHVSLDELVKGDIKTMEEKVNEKEIGWFKRMSNLYTVMMVVMIAAPIPLLRFLGTWGVAIWVIWAAATLYVAFKVEAYKKKHDLYTYREILAFLNGQTLDDIEKAREEGKRKYQQLALMLLAGVIALIVCLALGYLFAHI